MTIISAISDRLRGRTPVAVEIVAVCSILWAFLVFGPETSLFYRTLERFGWIGPWFVIHGCLGLWLLFVSRFRVSERQMEAALTCNAVALAVMFVPFLLTLVITPVTVVMPYLAFVCIRLSRRDFGRW